MKKAKTVVKKVEEVKEKQIAVQKIIQKESKLKRR